MSDAGRRTFAPAADALPPSHPFVAAAADVVVAAPAKINLALHVVGRRADGYHLLDSLVAFAMPDDGDAVAMRFAASGAGEAAAGLPRPSARGGASAGAHATSPPSPDGRSLRTSPRSATADAVPPLAVVGPFAAGVPGGPDNIAVRAARLVGGIDALTLWKGLPVASGIGGGSADAAAVVRAAALRRGLDPAAFAEAALALGADVPVCLRSRPARMSGIGERLAPVALPAAPLVLVNPGVPVATAAVFARLAARDNPPMPDLPPLPDAAALAAYLASTRNDLEGPAVALAPPIATALATIAAAPGCLLARMSGSGATAFGLFADAAAQRAAAAALARPGWWVRAATILP